MVNITIPNVFIITLPKCSDLYTGELKCTSLHSNQILYTNLITHSNSSHRHISDVKDSRKTTALNCKLLTNTRKAITASNKKSH